MPSAASSSSSSSISRSAGSVLLHANLSPNDLKKPGSVGLFDDNLLVRCGDSTLSIDSITPAGKKRMSGADFARGARLTAEDRFE